MAEAAGRFLGIVLFSWEFVLGSPSFYPSRPPPPPVPPPGGQPGAFRLKFLYVGKRKTTKNGASDQGNTLARSPAKDSKPLDRKLSSQPLATILRLSVLRLSALAGF